MHLKKQRQKPEGSCPIYSVPFLALLIGKHLAPRRLPTWLPESAGMPALPLPPHSFSHSLNPWPPQGSPQSAG